MLLDTKYKQQTIFFPNLAMNFYVHVPIALLWLFSEKFYEGDSSFSAIGFFFLLLNRKIFNSSQINDFTLISKDITVDDHLYDESNLAPCH